MMHSFKLRLITISMIVVFALLLPATVRSQTRSHTAENLNYVVVLPSAQWRSNDGTEFH